MRRQKQKYRPSKRPKLYLDENFFPDCIHKLSKFDVKHATIDYSYAGREDKFHYSFAASSERILLTIDKDYLSDSKYKLPDTFGIIIISVPYPVVPERINMLLEKLIPVLVKLGYDSLKGHKIFVTEEGWKIWHLENGKKIKEYYSW